MSRFVEEEYTNTLRTTSSKTEEHSSVMSRLVQ